MPNIQSAARKLAAEQREKGGIEDGIDVSEHAQISGTKPRNVLQI
jgi:hypothetical protein